MERRHRNGKESAASVAGEEDSGHHKYYGDLSAARGNAHHDSTTTTPATSKSARNEESRSRIKADDAESTASFAAASSSSRYCGGCAAANPTCEEADGVHEGHTHNTPTSFRYSHYHQTDRQAAVATFFHSHDHHDSTQSSRDVASPLQQPPSYYSYYPTQSPSSFDEEERKQQQQEEEDHPYLSHSNDDIINNSNNYSDSSSPRALKSEPKQSHESIRDKLLPDILSLATRLVPTVLQRLTRQEQTRIRHFGEQEREDDFPGKCAPLGHSSDHSATSTSSSSLTMHQRHLDRGGTIMGNLKTSGLNTHDDCVASDSMVPPSSPSPSPIRNGRISDLEMGDPMEYLPQSAALLVSALENSATKKRRGGGKKSWGKDGENGNGNDNDDERGDEEGSFALGELPSLVNEHDNGNDTDTDNDNTNGSIMKSRTGSFDHDHHRRKLSHSDMERLDREAEALMDSIRRGDLGGGGSTSGALASAARNLASDGGIGGNAGAATAATTTASFDDDDSIRGEMLRLNQSIECLQRDLQNVDISFFDEMYDDDDDDGFGGWTAGSRDGKPAIGVLARLKLWFSRGAIMEQKLLHTFASTLPHHHHHHQHQHDHHHGGDGLSRTATRTTGYADNPVLVWSMALMWAFVILIAGHAKIADWVEGGDAGQLADIVEWLFYSDG
ncbi:hypothetical protein ACHAXS_008991 [Conticribra weissflogii]